MSSASGKKKEKEKETESTNKSGLEIMPIYYGSLVSSAVLKVADEPDPDPRVQEAWKELWTKEGDVPFYMTHAAQAMMDQSRVHR